MIENLRSNTIYRFRLRAVNDVGHSSWSEPSESIVTHPLGMDIFDKLQHGCSDDLAFPLAPPRPERPTVENVQPTEFVFYWEVRVNVLRMGSCS